MTNRPDVEAVGT